MVSRKKYLDPNPRKVTASLGRVGRGAWRGVETGSWSDFGSHEGWDGMGWDGIGSVTGRSAG